ncbi:MAG: hypothetical protein GWP62_08090 [Gammaproteobacteria bacterium]|jgi:hypothetical protein|nr:hypothetical protein [Gammaproteobacteria bacterium]
MMRALKVLFLGLLVLALLNSPSTASTFSEADGWYTWRVDSPVNMGSSCCGNMSGELAIYVRSENGGPVRIRAYNTNCDKGPEENVTDLGTLSLAQSDALLLEIVQARNVDMDVREDALLWLVLTGSDETFEYVDRLLSSR